MSFVGLADAKQQHGRRASDNDDLGPLGKAFKFLRKRVERFPDVADESGTGLRYRSNTIIEAPLEAP
jgi:hypothetical protein